MGTRTKTKPNRRQEMLRIVLSSNCSVGGGVRASAAKIRFGRSRIRQNAEVHRASEPAFWRMRLRGVPIFVSSSEMNCKYGLERLQRICNLPADLNLESPVR